jgi:glucosamine-6-phosphate deaminase
MTVSQMLKAKCIVSVVPHAVKAEAVKNTLMQQVNNMVPATILKTHPDWSLYLDSQSAQQITVLPE